MSAVKNYFSLVKFSHTIFALPFALIGFVVGVRAQWMAQAPVEHFFLKLFLVLICMVTARSTAMAFNRYLDRHFDKLNPELPLEKFQLVLLKRRKHCCLFLSMLLYLY